MLNLFLSGRGLSVFILPLLLLVYAIKSFVNPVFIVDSPTYLFTKIDLFWSDSPYLKLLLGVLVSSLLAFYVNKVFNLNGFYQTENSIPSLLLIIMIGSWSGFHFFSPLLLSLLFILIGLNRILKVYHQNNILSEVFDAGFYLGLASIIYYPAVLFLISYWIFLSMNRAFSFREYFFPLMGVALPFFFLAGYFFYFDLPIEFLYPTTSENIASLISANSLTQRIFLVLTGLSFLLALPFFIKQISRSKIKTKNSKRLILMLLVNSMFIYWLSFTFFPIHNRALLMIIPLVFIIPFYYYSVSSLYRNLLFYFWIISSLLFNFFPII